MAFPYAIAPTGLTATDSMAAHMQDMIEQLLLTNPGERVNQPGFGGGMYQLVFAPNSPELAATLQLTLQAAVQRYLADVIAVQGLVVTADAETLQVELSYVLRQTGAAGMALVALPSGAG